ncbi:MAG: GumC family protein, partial [Calditrichaceae bacterium]
MLKNSSKSSDNYTKKIKDELNFYDVIQIINRRRHLIAISVISVVVLVSLYTFFAKPVYESSVLFKKEKMQEQNSQDEFRQMLSMQMLDEIDTEIEIFKSRAVLQKVIFDLNLMFSAKSAEFSDNDRLVLNADFNRYKAYIENREMDYRRLPEISEFNIYNEAIQGGKYYLTLSNNRLLQLFDAENENLLQSVIYSIPAELGLRGFVIRFDWKNVTAEDRFYFDVEDFEHSYISLSKNTAVERVGKTNLFKLSVKSYSPQTAQLIANTIAEKYRESRLAQKRQTIHYSFDFVDEQLKETSQKLQAAEMALSDYKSEHQIVLMDQNSRDVIDFLSNLETEKIKTDLELVEYRNKLTEMSTEIKSKGYFDQTYLTPNRSEIANSPFSILLSQLSDAEIRRLELLQKRKSSHPDVVTIDEQISQIKAKLGDYNQNTITSYEIIINSLNKKQSSLNSLIRKYSDKIEKLPNQESQLADLMRNKSVYDKMFTLLIDKREELRMAEYSKLQDIIIVDKATVPIKPVYPKKALNLILALLLGAVIGLVVVFVSEFFDKRVTTIDEIENAYSFPVLAVLPKYTRKLIKKISDAEAVKDRLVTMMDDQPDYKESYRVLRAKLMNFVRNGKKVIMITSCEEDTGKTSIISNFAI